MVMFVVIVCGGVVRRALRVSLLIGLPLRLVVGVAELAVGIQTFASVLEGLANDCRHLWIGWWWVV